MSKINCDVCGTAYPETATQCPICGCVRSAESATTEDAATKDGSYTYVKGGRFSRANVRKRNQGKPQQDVPPTRDEMPEEPIEEDSKADKGLVIAVCVLLLAVVAVVIYIITRFFGSGATPESGGENRLPVIATEPSSIVTLPPETTEETEVPTTVETVPPATEEKVEAKEPTTETTEQAEVPTTVETVPPTTEETVEATEPTTETVNNNYYVKPYKTNKDKQNNDASIPRWNSFELKLIDATGEVMEVEWQVEDPEICSVEGNTVKGLKKGTTKVYVVIDGETYYCIVRVK